MPTGSSIIEGVFIAAITPRRPDLAAIDLASALELIDFLGRSGAQGIALLGSTGEFLHFDTEDRLHLIQFAIKRSPVPVLVNVSHSSLDGALNLAHAAVDYGAAGLLLMPPYFFPYGQEEIGEFFLRFARQIGDAAPIVLYNVPDYTTALDIETAARLLSTGLFAGIKDSSGRSEYLLGLKPLKESRGIRLMVGNDRAFTSSRRAGADGVVSGVACAVPELMLGLDRAIRRDDPGKQARLEARLQEFLSWIDRFPTPMGIREAVSLRGLRAGPHALPPGESLERQLARFREWFPGWLEEVQQAASRD